MKKYIISITGALFVFLLIAGNPVNLFLKNLTVLHLNSTDIDSIKFDTGAVNMQIYKNDNSQSTIEMAAVDSMNFKTDIDSVPQLDSVSISSILNTTATAKFSIKSVGISSIVQTGVCWNTITQPTIKNNKSISTSLSSASEINITGLTAATTYYIRAYAINATDTVYSPEKSFTTTNYTLPTVETVSATFNYTTNKATVVAKVTSNGGCTLTERGICWSTTSNPTINNSKYFGGFTVGQFYGTMSDLVVNSVYYVRTYATNCVGTAYGNVIKVQPLMGAVTYSIQADLATTQPTYYNLIKAAMDSACWYFNRYTTFRGNIYCYYNSGIPTAQASYHGSIGFGSNTTYMWVGTAMHEMCHFVGSGTTSSWQALTNGNWTGSVASALLLKETGEVLKGDDMHFWPYGVNYKSEITGLGDAAAQKKGLILCAKLAQAMCVNDAGLPNTW